MHLFSRRCSVFEFILSVCFQHFMGHVWMRTQTEKKKKKVLFTLVSWFCWCASAPVTDSETDPVDVLFWSRSSRTEYDFGVLMSSCHERCVWFVVSCAGFFLISVIRVSLRCNGSSCGSQAGISCVSLSSSFLVVVKNKMTCDHDGKDDRSWTNYWSSRYWMSGITTSQRMLDSAPVVNGKQEWSCKICKKNGFWICKEKRHLEWTMSKQIQRKSHCRQMKGSRCKLK